MDQKSNIYTIVFYTSLLITFVLIAMMLLAPLESQNSDQTRNVIPESSVEKNAAAIATTASVKEKSISFTEEELKVILSSALKETVGFEIDTLMITNNAVTIMSKAHKESIRKHIEASGISITKAADVALKIAPDTIDVDCDIQIVTNKTTHRIEFAVKQLAILGFIVPVELLPDSVCTSINDFINAKRDELGLRDLCVTLENGKMVLSGL